jgi:hypothetical protein
MCKSATADLRAEGSPKWSDAKSRAQPNSGLQIMNFTVHVGFDETSNRYYVDASDIPGLNVETETFEQFVEVVLDVAPDLLGQTAAGTRIDFHRQVVIAS